MAKSMWSRFGFLGREEFFYVVGVVHCFVQVAEFVFEFVDWQR